MEKQEKYRMKHQDSLTKIDLMSPQQVRYHNNPENPLVYEKRP